VGFFVFSGSDGSNTDASPPLTAEVAAPDVEEPAAAVDDAEPAPQVAVEDEPQIAVEDEPQTAVGEEPAAESVVVPEVRTIDVAGEQVDATWWQAATATHVLVAAPSLNSDVDDLAGFAARLAGQDCANVVAFDSSQAPGARIYSHFIENFDDFGFDTDAAFSTLGSSATAADALIAADRFGGVDVFLFSPSDPLPFTWEEITPRIGLDGIKHVVVRITTGDLQYRPVFDLWIAAGFEGYVVDGENHGTAFFNEPAAEPVLKEVFDHMCLFDHD
jgi:hypothetical protein